MSRGIARLNDRVEGTCRANANGHPRRFVGYWDTCSDSCIADGLGVIRVGDIGHTDCGHTFVAEEGSSSIAADGIDVHRVGDPVRVLEGGEGITVQGSDTVLGD